MSDVRQIYTYRGGERIEINKSYDSFVVATPINFHPENGCGHVDQVAPMVTRVALSEAVLEIAMMAMHEIAPVHHAYYVAATGQEFLISDKVFVSFGENIVPAQIDALMKRYALLRVASYPDSTYLFRLTDQTGMNPVKLVRTLTEKEAIVKTADHDLHYRLHKHPNIEFPIPGDLAQDVVIGLIGDSFAVRQDDLDRSSRIAGWAYWESYPGIAYPRLVTQINLAADRGRVIAHNTPQTAVSLTESIRQSGGRLLPVSFESSDDFVFLSDSQLYDTLSYLGGRVDVLSIPWGAELCNQLAPIVLRLANTLSLLGGRKGRGIRFLSGSAGVQPPYVCDSKSAVLAENPRMEDHGDFEYWSSGSGCGRSGRETAASAAQFLPDRPHRLNPSAGGEEATM